MSDFVTGKGEKAAQELGVVWLDCCGERIGGTYIKKDGYKFTCLKCRKVYSGHYNDETGEVSAHALDGEWIQPEGNPFLHGCCDCGLMHSVEWRLVGADGEEVKRIFRIGGGDSGQHLQVKFTRDQAETERLREYLTPGEVKKIMPYLISDIKSGPHIVTYMGVDVRLMNKSQLLLMLDFTMQELRKLRGY